MKKRGGQKGGQRGGGFFDNITSFAKNNAPSENIQCWVKYILTTVIFIIVCTFFWGILSNSSSAVYNVQKYFFLLTLPLIMLFLYVLNVHSSPSSRNLFLTLSGIVLFIGGIFYFYIRSMNSTGFMNYYSNQFLLFFIALIALSVIYNYFVQYLENLSGWPGFIAQLIFYIPCLFSDLWNYIFQELQMTSYSTYALLIIEVICILFYIYSTQISSAITGLNNGHQLLKNVYRLEKGPLVIANSDLLKNKGVSEKYLTNYCISMWIFIKPQNATDINYNKEVEIFSYGYKDDSGIEHVKPMIRYYGGDSLNKDQTSERDKFVFYFSKLSKLGSLLHLK
jgi:hypothetical protein